MSEHIWDRGVEDRSPVLRCRVCGRIWWPEWDAIRANHKPCHA